MKYYFVGLGGGNMVFGAYVAVTGPIDSAAFFMATAAAAFALAGNLK